MASGVQNKIDQFLGDGARSTKFSCTFQFNDPYSFPSADAVAVAIESTSFPNVEHQIIEFKYKGRTVPIRGQVRYPQEWECSFYLTEDHALKKAFEAWIVALDEQHYYETNPHSDEKRLRNANSKSFIKDIAIYQFNFSAKNQMAKYILHNAFPIRTSSVQLTSQGPGEVEKFTVTFAYSHYTVDNYTTGDGTFLDELRDKIGTEVYGFTSNIMGALSTEIGNFLNSSGLSNIMSPSGIIDSINFESMSQPICDLIHGNNTWYEAGNLISDSLNGMISNISSSVSKVASSASNAIKNTVSGLF